MRIEAYLLQLNQVQRRWHRWLSDMQLAATQRQAERLGELQLASQSLNDELREVSELRLQMIEQARLEGWPVRNLRSIAERLPAWNRPRFRASVNAARTQIEQLRRLHIATWVVLNQCFQYYDQMAMLITYGAVRHDVYEMPRSSLMESGGQLLDASL